MQNIETFYTVWYKWNLAEVCCLASTLPGKSEKKQA